MYSVKPILKKSTNVTNPERQILMPHINKFSSETLSSVEPSEERNKEANKKKNNVSFIFEKVSGFESL